MNTLDSDQLPARGAAAAQARRFPRLLPERFGGGPASLEEHLTRYGLLPHGWGGPWREQLIAEVGRAGLTGRGGAAFPTARKLAAVAGGPDMPVVIANGTEGEPASAKDKVLLACAPHLVLDGAVLAAHMVGARQAIVVVHDAVREVVDGAAAERRRARLDRVKIKVMTGADRFVGGEASALVNWGARWFRSLGTTAEPGSMLVTIIGAVRQPGVREIEIGMPLSEVLGRAGGPAAPLGALLIGGYFGTWADPAVAGPLPFSAEGLSAVGGSPGAGLVAALPAD